MIISENAMGTVCCHFLHIIKLGKNIKDTKLEAGNNSIRFIDFDKDGIDEIEFWDNVIVGFLLQQQALHLEEWSTDMIVLVITIKLLRSLCIKIWK